MMTSVSIAVISVLSRSVVVFCSPPGHSARNAVHGDRGRQGDSVCGVRLSAPALGAGSAAFREQLVASAKTRVRALEHRLRSAGIDFIHIDASGSVVDPLVRFFRMRERRSRR